jgi:putative protease
MNESALSDCGELKRHPLADRVYLIEEKNRPGEYMPIFEDEHGTYIMNSKDLRAVEHVERLVNIGIDSLKIEGRTKSHYYVARTAQVYRQAIDNAVAGRPFNPESLGVLENLANRGYTDGFYQRHHTAEHQNYLTGYSKSNRQQFCGEITGYNKEKKMMEVDVKNRFAVGDELEIILPRGNHHIKLEYMEDRFNGSMEVAPGGGYEVRIPWPDEEVEMGLITRLIKA